MNCSNCSSCGGCRREITLTQPDLDILMLLAQSPFLPLSRSLNGESPIFLQEDMSDTISASCALTALQLQGIIRLDYDIPLNNFDYSRFPAYRVHGSFALTALGQETLEMLEKQGISEE